MPTMTWQIERGEIQHRAHGRNNISDKIAGQQYDNQILVVVPKQREKRKKRSRPNRNAPGGNVAFYCSSLSRPKRHGERGG